MLTLGCLFHDDSVLTISLRLIVIVLDLLYKAKIDAIFQPNDDKNTRNYSSALKTQF